MCIMCEDIWIDVTNKPNSEEMVSPQWKTYFRLIAKDYPGYEKVNFINDRRFYTLKGYLVDGENPDFFKEIDQVLNNGLSYILERFKRDEVNGNNEAPF